MKIVIAPDSFKECASPREVASAIAMGIRRVLPNADIVLAPMADGGEGTVEALVAATSGKLVEREVTGPIGKPVHAAYGITGDGSTAIIEMSSASGLALVPESLRNPRLTTTRGTGELIADALDHGVRRIIAGIGGSATNDAGAGMAQALGYSLRDAHDQELPPGGAALRYLAVIDDTRRHPALAECEVRVACDVNNPLCGPTGASITYGPQKGATAEMACELDLALRHFAEIVEQQLGVAVLDLPGGGAAGGMGAGLVAFTGASLCSGVDLIAEACGLAEAIQGADLVITGEGRIDYQTASGKGPSGVARIAQKAGVPAIALAGSLGEGYQALYDIGIHAVFSICPRPMPLTEALTGAPDNLAAAAESVMRLWLLGKGALPR